MLFLQQTFLFLCYLWCFVRFDLHVSTLVDECEIFSVSIPLLPPLKEGGGGVFLFVANIFGISAKIEFLELFFYFMGLWDPYH